MGQVQSTFGMITGKVGSFRLSNWNGINVVAQQPTSYTDANTAVQQGNRSTFKALGQLGRQMLAALRIGLSQYKTKTTPWATFLKLSKDAFTYVGGKASLTAPEKLVIARGELPKPENPDVVSIVNGTVNMTWNNNSATFGASGTDVAFGVVVNKDTLEVWYGGLGASRQDGAGEADSPAGTTAANIAAYLFFVKATDFNVTSDSQYFV